MVYRQYHREFKLSQKGLLVCHSVGSVSLGVHAITERSVHHGVPSVSSGVGVITERSVRQIQVIAEWSVGTPCILSVSSGVPVITEKSVSRPWRTVCVIGSSGHHRKVSWYVS